MRVLGHPFTIDPSGSVVTVEQWSDEQARQITQAVVSTRLGERALAPLFGITDPTGRGVSEDELTSAVELCEPDLRVTYVVAYDPAKSRQAATVSAVWRDNEEA